MTDKQAERIYYVLKRLHKDGELEMSVLGLKKVVMERDKFLELGIVEKNGGKLRITDDGEKLYAQLAAKWLDMNHIKQCLKNYVRHRNQSN
jgi:DNA-binding PadR family transcriptional regulator